MRHDSRIDWPPPLGAPVTMCCWEDVEAYDPSVNDWDGWHGADVTVGVEWWDTWAEAIQWWWEGVQHTTFLGTPEQVADMLTDQMKEIAALEAKYC